jgi:nucleotide-binding universal stress UspA family protein/nitrite reductase/ring-hydroxylating ferredoxin subunit
MAYKRIVIGTDGSATAGKAERVAAQLAKSCGAKLVIVHGYLEEAAPTDFLEKARAFAQEQGVEASAEAVRGQPADVIVELADTSNADLVVVGNRGTSRRERFLIGSVPDRISHHAPCDVLVVRTQDPSLPQDEGLYRKILIATDGSPTADRAAQKGFALADRLGAAVTLVFVGHPKTGEIVLHDTAGKRECEQRVLNGDPAEKIVDTAEEEGHDLVIVGNKGMSGKRKLFLHPVPQKVFQYAPCDTLIAMTVTQLASELEPGEGGIIVLDRRKLAAYRDESGKMVTLSPKCTHMGCTVRWNAREKTWDCGCHGSRFAISGEVIEGPAQKPLAPAEG